MAYDAGIGRRGGSTMASQWKHVHVEYLPGRGEGSEVWANRLMACLRKQIAKHGIRAEVRVLRGRFRVDDNRTVGLRTSSWREHKKWMAVQDKIESGCRL